jgi:hypothetical protein
MALAMTIKWLAAVSGVVVGPDQLAGSAVTYFKRPAAPVVQSTGSY